MKLSPFILLIATAAARKRPVTEKEKKSYMPETS